MKNTDLNKKIIFSGIATLFGFVGSALADEVVYFDPTMPAKKGSPVSEFVWAIDALDRQCEQFNNGSSVEKFCENVEKVIYKGFDGEKDPINECFDPRDLERTPLIITECGLGVTFSIAASIQHLFQVSLKNKRVDCPIKGDYECFSIDGGVDPRTIFAFPNQPI